MPMLFAGRNPHHIARPYLDYRTSLGLDPAHACDDIERLPQWMSMPIGARAGLEGNAIRSYPRRGFGLYLIHMIVDSIAYERTSDGRNLLTLTMMLE